MSTTARQRAMVPVPAGWSITLYPGAGEAHGVFRSSVVGSSRDRGETLEGARPDDSAARRARGQVRRYCAEHGLSRLGTLTYAGEGQHDPKMLRRAVGAFFKALRRELGQTFPYLWVPEWHPGGHGLHVHFAVGQYVDRGPLVRSWPHGFVHITLLGDVPAGVGGRGIARRAGRYVAKYIGKDAGSGGQPAGLHRYEVAQGFRPKEIRILAPTVEDAIAQAEALMGEDAECVWRSRDLMGWDGPPAVFLSWG